MKNKDYWFTREEKAEIKRNKTGKKTLLISIVLFIITFTISRFIENAFWLSIFAWFVVAPVIGIAFGIALILMNDSASEIQKRNAHEEAMREIMLERAKIGLDFDFGNTSVARAARQKEETKKIVKGAVVGSIVAGDVGAVVGATIAKNKIDNENKK